MSDPHADSGSLPEPDGNPSKDLERKGTDAPSEPREQPVPDAASTCGTSADAASRNDTSSGPADRPGIPVRIPEAEPAAWWQPEPDERLLWAGAPATRGSVEEPADAVALVTAVLLLLGSAAACVRFGPLRFVGHLSPLLIGGAVVFLVTVAQVWRHRRWLRRLRYAVTDRRVIVGVGRFRRAWRHEALPRPFAVPRRRGRMDIVYGDRTPAATERELRSYLAAGTKELPLNPWPVLLRLDDETADRLIAAYG